MTWGAMGKTKMDFDRARALLDEINAVIAEYDPVLKEKARDILLEALFAEHRLGGLYPTSPLPTQHDHAGKKGGEPFVSIEKVSDFPALLARWHPQRASEKTILAAYFLSRSDKHQTLTSQGINSVLKRHGLVVSNITRAIETNLRASPPLIDQLRKRGSTRQARKEYVITLAGERFVEERLGYAD